MRRLLYILLLILMVFLLGTIGGSFYMLSYSLSPRPDRQDTAACFAELKDNYPETRPWLDSLYRAHALRDTFVVMPSGERHHALYVRQQPASRSTAVVVHGWRDQAIRMLMIARLYERMGYNIVVPDLHAHGLSEGEAIGMGWKDRLDILHWMELFKTDTMVVHGISMGAATTMNVSGETPPAGIRDLRFVEDCGYSSVWDEFHHELADQFGLPDFPLMYATSMLCRLRYGWCFSEASPLRQVRKCPYPMLFIHGSSDTFVPTWMVHPLYDAKSGSKAIWITKDTEHALSYRDYPEEYAQRVAAFVKGALQ